MVVVREDDTLHLVDRDGGARPLAKDVLPDLAVDESGARVAFVRRRDDGTVLELFEAATQTTRTIVSAFASADRPLFVDDRTLVFVGAPTPGTPAFHRVGLELGAPVRIAPFGAPLPATRDGYAFTSGLIRFHDGTRVHTLDPKGAP